MGMTIENSIETLTSILDEATESEDSVCYVTSADAGSLKLAIETMRKYQKIEQAYSAYLETMNPDTLADLISTII